MVKESVLERLLARVFFTANALKVFEPKREMCFFVVRGKLGPRWLVPCQPEYGMPVLSLWRPYRLISRIKWFVVQGFYRSGLLGWVPGVQQISLQSAVFSVVGCQDELIPIVYVGSPGLQQKAVMTLVDLHTCKPQAVIKVALSDGAVTSMRREVFMLKALAGLDVENVPKLLWADENGGCTCQSVINGKLTGRSLTCAHVDWLLNLPRSNTMMSVEKICADFDTAMARVEEFSPAERAILLQIFQDLKGVGLITGVLVHGDFAPWNLKWQERGSIAAVDWEEARFDGLPLHDLSHFFMIQAYLFGGKSPYFAMLGSPLVKDYLFRVGLEVMALKPLILHYLVLMVSGQGGDCSKAFRKFLIRQIRLMVIQ